MAMPIRRPINSTAISSSGFSKSATVILPEATTAAAPMISQGAANSTDLWRYCMPLSRFPAKIVERSEDARKVAQKE